MAAWLQHPPQLADGVALDRLRQALEDVERRDDVEVTGGERNRADAAARDVAPAPLACQRQTVPGEIESVGLAELLQQREVRPRPAAAIEQPRIRAARNRDVRARAG